MHALVLSSDQQQVLEQVFTTTLDGRLRNRCQAVLMASRGRPRQQIAQDLGIHRTTLRRWLQAYQREGMDGLVIQWAPGQPRRIPEKLAPQIQAWVKDGPLQCGLDRANWTYQELADYLYQRTGIRVQRTTMRTFCQRHQIRPYRPTYRYLRADPVQQEIARHEVASLKKRHKTGAVCS